MAGEALGQDERHIEREERVELPSARLHHIVADAEHRGIMPLVRQADLDVSFPKISRLE